MDDKIINLFDKKSVSPENKENMAYKRVSFNSAGAVIESDVFGVDELNDMFSNPDGTISEDAQRIIDSIKSGQTYIEKTGYGVIRKYSMASPKEILTEEQWLESNGFSADDATEVLEELKKRL